MFPWYLDFCLKKLFGLEMFSAEQRLEREAVVQILKPFDFLPIKN
jgi:hypothetical protein